MRQRHNGLVELMDSTDKKPSSSNEGSTPAERALAEAAERRAKAYGKDETDAPEIAGRKGPEPVRYGDWESKGIAYDF